MSEVCENALTKVDEARYFLALMGHTEESQLPLLLGCTAKQDYAYLLSAFVGACYGAIEYLWHGLKTSRPAVESFREKHRHIYGDESNGGWRALRENMPNFTLKNEYYFTGEPSGKPITKQCEDHLAELEKLIKQNCP